MNNQQYYDFLDKLVPFPYPEHNVNMTSGQMREERTRAANRANKFNECYKPKSMSRSLSSLCEKDVKVTKEYEDAYNGYLNAQNKAVAVVKKFNRAGWLVLIPILGTLLCALLATTVLEDFFEDYILVLDILIIVLFLPFLITIISLLPKISKLSYGSIEALESCKKMAKEIGFIIASNGYSDAKENEIYCYMKVNDEERQYQIQLEKKARKARTKKMVKLAILIIAIGLLVAGIVLSVIYWSWVKENIIYPGLAIIILIVLFSAALKKDKPNNQPGLISQIKEDRREKARQEEIKRQNMFYNNGGLDRCGRIPGLGEVVMSSDGRMINRIGSYEVYYSYSTGKINRIGPHEVTYSGDKIIRIGNMEVEYDGDRITHVKF